MIKKIIKTNKNWGLFLLFLITAAGFVSYKIVAKREHTTGPTGPYFVTIPIIRCAFGMPCIELQIESKTTEVGIDLGSLSHVCLSNELICELNEKKFIKKHKFRGFRGKSYQSDVYQVPEIKIGRMNFYSPEVKELNWEFEKDAYVKEVEPDKVESEGTVGWQLFCHTNLLLDCEHSLIGFCDSLETLKLQGYPVELFTEIPLLLDRDYVEFEAETDSGHLRCVVDTGSGWNILNAEPETHDLDSTIFEKYKTKQFKIANTEFGETTFRKIKMPLEFDAIIGMEFLCDKITFIDFKKEKLYFYSLPEEEVKVVANSG